MDLLSDVSWWELAVAIVAAGILSFVSAVAGFGGAVLLLPVFTAVFGIRVAIPVLTLTQLVSNGSRAWFNRRDIDWRVVGWFAVGALPAGIVGGLVLAKAPLAPLKRLLGAFLLAVVAWRHWGRRVSRMPLRGFAAVGAASGFGSALLGSVGPLTAPFFLAYGLTRGTYIGTEAMSALVMHGAKLLAYGAGSLLTPTVLVLGAVLTPTAMLGSWLGKRTVDRISDRLFTGLVEIGLVVAGALLLLGLT